TAGRTAATIRFEMGESFRYSANLTPAGRADLVLPDLETPLTGVTGTIRIGGAKVTLDRCQGRLADGTVQVNGVLDFEPVKSKLTFQVSAQGLDVPKLPAEWALPAQVSGQLRGQANLELLIDPDGKIEPRGGGEGSIENAKIAGLPAEVKLRLRGDGRRYRFESDMAA